MTEETPVLKDVRARLAAGEQLDWNSLTPEEQDACQVILDETRAKFQAAAPAADGQ